MFNAQCSSDKHPGTNLEFYSIRLALLICFLFFYTIILHAQENDYISVDNIILKIPTTSTGSTDSIASFIQSNFKKEKEKFRAIHRWLTFNIKYDTDSMYVFNWGADPGKKVTAALRRRKGVCENFTAIFNEIAHKSKLISFVVSGYTKQSGSIDKAGHTWCAVNADGEWLFCDPTWDVGYRTNTNYFLISPFLFIESHMPFDPLWQLLDQPVSKEAFYKGYFHSKKEQSKYIFTDSVKVFLDLNELQRLEAAARRIRQNGFVNDLEKNNLAFIEMQASIIYEDRDMNLYNSAVDDLNKATELFNDFIEYRNKQFTPERPDSEMNNLLIPAENKITSAQKKLDQLDHSTVNAQYNSYSAKERLNNFRTRVKEQKEFLDKYLSSPVTDRKKLFYN